MISVFSCLTMLKKSNNIPEEVIISFLFLGCYQVAVIDFETVSLLRSIYSSRVSDPER